MGKRMLTGKGSGCDGAKSVVVEKALQFSQRIIESTVSERNYRDGKGTVSADCFQIRKQQVWQPPCISRAAEDD